MNPAPNQKWGVTGSAWQSSAANSLLHRGLLHLGNALLCGLLFIAAVLRETPDFWLNSGGYPVLLRGCVYWFFLPGAMICLLGVLCGVWVSLRLLRQNGPGGWLGLAMCALQILALTAMAAIVLANNLSNLFHGAPLHHHPM